MFRLLGILTVGNLLCGGRHHHRAIRRGLMYGALLGYLANRDYDMNRVRREAREAARQARHAAREAARNVREEIRNARREVRNARNAEYVRQAEERRETVRPEKKAEAANVIRALPTSGTNEAKEIEELVGDLERNSGTGATAADVPTIDFPEEDGKYHTARKYGYA